MTSTTKTVFKALAVLTVICAPLLILHQVPSGQNTTDQIQPGAPLDEPKIGAANPANAAWKVLPNIKHARFESTAVQYRDDIYVFNGFGIGIKAEPAVEKFDAGTQSWSVIGKTSIAQGTAVTHNGVIVNGNEVWLLGGRVGNHPGAVTSKVWKFNLTTYAWTKGPKLPVPVAAGGAALVDNRIYWFGGLDANAKCDVANHYVYDLDNPANGWSDISSIAPMPIPRNHFATAVHDGLIYAIGGQFTHGGCGAGTPDTNLVHVFDPATNTWTQKASLPAIQSHIEPSTFVHKGAIYVVGGATNGNKVYRYDPSNDIWDTVAQLPQALLAPVARVIDNQLVVSSGGAPAITPSYKTYAIDMTGLLLPSAIEHNIANDDTTYTETGTELDTDTSEAGLVSLEAEYYDTSSKTATHQWVAVNLPGASNNAAMTTTPNSGKLTNDSQGSPSMAYFAYFDRPGTWYLWVRGWGDSNQGSKNDSLHAGLNGTLSATADKIDNFPASWNWTNNTRDGVRASIKIPAAGIHAVNLWMREDGLTVDKILLTTDSNYKPTGIGNAVIDNEPSSTEVTQVLTESTPVDSIEYTVSEQTSSPTTEVTEVTEATVTQNTVNTNSVTAATTSTTSNVTSINGIVAIEVENFDTTIGASNKKWVRSSQPGASGNASMVTTPNTGTIKNSLNGSPTMNYSVYFTEPGNYTVWLRGWGDTVGSEGKNDSAHIGINGTLGTAAAIQNFPAKWQWSSKKRSGGTATINVPSAGLHTINIGMREDGLILDKLLLARNPAYTPTGHGPTITSVAVSESTSNGSPTVTVDKPESDIQTSTSTSLGNNVIAVEVENYASKSVNGAHQWTVNNKPGASNQAMQATPNVGKLYPVAKGSTTLTYPLLFSEAGTYTVWLRGFGDSDGAGKNDSVYVGINNQASQVLENFPGTWTWSNKKRGGGSVKVTIPVAGEHVLSLSIREDGIILDKIILTKDTSFVPDNLGPAVTTPSTNSTNTAAPDNNSASNTKFQNQWHNHNTSNGSTVEKRHEAGGVAFNGKIYVLGGRGTRNVSIFDPVTNKWSYGATPPLELNHFQPVAYKSKIWVIGAFTGPYPNETSVADIYTYTPATNSWKKEGTIPQKRRRGSTAAVLHGDYIYIVGGNTNGHKAGAVAWLDRFNPSTGQWQALSNAPTARDHITASVSNNKLVVAAGRQSAYPNVFANTIAATNVYDLNTQKWSIAKSIPTQRAGAMTVTVGQEVIVIGGEVGNNSIAKNTVESYNVISNTWRKLTPLQIGRHSGAAAALNNKIHVIAGSKKKGGSPETTAHEVLKY